MNPLTLARDSVPSASRFERAMYWIPILGWMVTQLLERRRFNRATAPIARQLRSRPKRPKSVQSSANERDASNFLITLIRRTIRMPDATLLPDDELYALLFLDHDGFGVIDFIFSLEKWVGRKISRSEFEQICLMTVRQAAEWIETQIARAPKRMHSE